VELEYNFMPMIEYVAKRFNSDHLKKIEQANTIITEYQAQGFDLTLRQLYYQFVSRDLIPNTLKDYKNLGTIISDGRLAGLIDWNAIVDRTRNLLSNSHWAGPAEIVEACAKQFQIDKWDNQEYRPEVWIEKDALLGVIERVCRSNDVSYFSCRGYTSQSEMWAAAQRLNGYIDEGQTPVIIHLGDHDSSGIDMSRDIEERLELFTGESIRIDRIALNMDQVKKHRPPPNPAKLTDPRAKKYVAKFGTKSWELDALEPKVLERLIQSTIDGLRESDKWDERVEEQDAHRATLLKAAGKMK
jgi:hypothetical protein